MVDSALIEIALEVIGAVFGELDGPPSDPPRAAPAMVRSLSDDERELATAIQRRRGVTPGVAEDLVIWLRNQAPGLHNEQRAP